MRKDVIWEWSETFKLLHWTPLLCTMIINNQWRGNPHHDPLHSVLGHVPDEDVRVGLCLCCVCFCWCVCGVCVWMRKQSDAFYGRVTTVRGCGRRSGGWGAKRSPSKLIFEITTSFLKSALQIRACPLSFNASFCEVINLRIRHTSFFLLR